MATVKMLNMSGAEVGTIELADAVFGITPNQYAVHAAVKNYLANQRQGTQSAKNRGEVRGGGRKPFRQKGTGRHRQGKLHRSFTGRRRRCICTEAERLQIYDT